MEAAIFDRCRSARRDRRRRLSSLARQRAQLRSASVRTGVDLLHRGRHPYREDQLGGLSLTIEGLKRRDQLVFRVAHARNIPVMVTFAGGYAQRVEDTVTIHCNTVIAAKEEFGR